MDREVIRCKTCGLVQYRTRTGNCRRCVRALPQRLEFLIPEAPPLEEQGVEAVLLEVGEGHVELLRPLGEDTPVGKFLAGRGPGLHHVAYQADDIEATLGSLRDGGVRLIDETPRTGIRNSRVAFVHPRSTGGVLTEIVQPAEDH